MSLRKFALFLPLLWMGFAGASRAQVGAYVQYSAQALSGITCLDPAGKCSSTGGKVNPSGLEGGVYFDFRNIGPVRLGVDVRGGEARSNKSAVTAAGGQNATTDYFLLGGVRGSVGTPIKWLRPYAQISAGWARSDATEPCATVTSGTATLCVSQPYDNFVQYEGFVGADVKIFSVMSLRPVELGIGNMNRVGNGTGPSSLLVKSIGAGIVFHLP